MIGLALSLFEPGSRVRALPSWERPRLLFLDGDAKAVARRTAMHAGTRLSANVVRALERRRAVVTSSPALVAPGGEIGAWIAGGAGGRVSAVLLVPRRDGEERLVAAVEDARCEAAAFAKVAAGPRGVLRLDREREMLAALAWERAPRVLAARSGRDGVSVLVLSAVGRREARWMVPPPSAAACLVPVASAAAAEPIGSHPWVLGLLARTDLDIRHALEPLGGRDWPVVPVHGDFASWNVRVGPGDDWYVIDWEYGAMDGLPYVDLAHYALKAEVLMRRHGPAAARRAASRALGEAGGSGLRDEERAGLVALAGALALANAGENGEDPDAPPMRTFRAVAEGEGR